MKKPLLALLLAGLLCACSAGEDDRDTAPSADRADREGVFDDMVGTMDRAEGTEQLIKDGADARRRALEDQER